MINKLVTIAVLCFLSGCGSDNNATIAPYAVSMAIPVSCVIQQPAEPEWLAENTTYNNDVEYLRAVLIDLARARAYVTELKAVLRACQ